MIKLASKDICTGCGACSYICPKKCIEMKDNGIYGVLPYIDINKCIECGRCAKVCPILNPVELNQPIETYAARSNNLDESFSSASGGISSTLYRYALEKGYAIAGAVQNNDFSVCLSLDDTGKMIEQFKNSKYVFSSALELYPEIDNLLKRGGRAIVAGLPCQIAAIRSLFKDTSNLLLVDIVCHGTTPVSYLQQHIKNIEKKEKQRAVRMAFRDPELLTYNFFFTLYNEKGERFYAKRTKDCDTYQYGYHRAISYRENCYNCQFACPRRTGDISLADYPGLGKSIPFSAEKKHINCVLINSEKGQKWFNELKEKKVIEAYLRSFNEAYLGNGQLRHPVKKSKGRLAFEIKIIDNNFDKVMYPIMKKGLMKEKMYKVAQIPVRAIRKFRRMFNL